jgi:anaphase-promoting complex subunit 11
MKFSVTSYNAVAVWKWDTHPNSSDHKLYHYAKNDTADTGAYDDDDDDDDEEDDVCGICRLAFESTCPDCKIPGDDCPLSESSKFLI